MSNPQNQSTKSDRANWRQIVAPYQQSDISRSIWQIVNSIGLYLLLWIAAALLLLNVSYLLALPVAILAGAVLVRVFIIFHDCGHGSFFKSRRANDIVGIITGILTFTPYYQWRHSHAVHHATAGDLDRRGTGDVWTITVDEYLALSPLRRLGYRIYRNPLILFVFGPALEFIVLHRIPVKGDERRERMSVHYTNLALLVIVVGVSLLIGFWNFVLIQLPVILVATTAGVWLFYVQHQFEDVYWARHEEWDYVRAALDGSSFYKLPRVIQWFTGNIGFHHIHHLSPRIPNYHLERAYNENPLFQESKTLTLLSSLKSAGFRLWDEDRRKLVGFDYINVYKAKLEASKETG